MKAKIDQCATEVHASPGIDDNLELRAQFYIYFNSIVLSKTTVFR